MTTARVLFVYSGFWVALCGFGLALSTYVIAGLAPNYLYCAFCFCSAYFTYSVDRLLTGLSPEDRLNRPGQWEWQDAHRVFLRVGVLTAGMGAAVLFFFLDKAMHAPLAVFAGLALLYLLPLPKEGRRARIRGILKPFLLTAVWIGGVVWIPLAGSSERPLVVPDDYYLIAVRFALFSANCVLFDVLDFRGDGAHGKLTFAVQYGRRAGMRLAIACLFICMGLVTAWSIHAREIAPLRELIPPLVFLFIAWNPRMLIGVGATSPYTRALLDGLLLLPLPVYGVSLFVSRVL